MASRIVKAAFTVIIKHAGLIQSIRDIVDAIDELPLTTPPQDPTMKNLLRKWLAASRMRTWLVEKRKEIDDMAERNKQLAVSSSKAREENNSKKKVEEKKKEDKGKAKGIKKKEAARKEELTFQVSELFILNKFICYKFYKHIKAISPKLNHNS